jgi:hypothetical protein
MAAMNDTSCIYSVPVCDWNGNCPPSQQQEALRALEAGQVLYFPDLGFEIAAEEKKFLSPAIVNGAKNVSFNSATGKLGGCACADHETENLAALMRRFSESAKTLLENVLSSYRGKLSVGRTSLRPIEIAGRASTWRKDDSRLHVDSFPSTPLQGRRILRVFGNVNPEGKARSWRLGEPFEDAARRFAPALRQPFPGSATVLQLLRVTRSRRSVYDHYMLQMHDKMKADGNYQQTSRQSEFAFPAGTTWVVFTDQVLHAATAGQYQLEQTFYLNVDDMVDPALSPLRTLERVMASKLAI